MGWRYLLFTLGGFTLVLWALRFFIFTLEESPRYLVGRGHDAEAVAVIQRLATYNGTSCSLTVEQLVTAGEAVTPKGADSSEGSKMKMLTRTSNYTMDHIKALFETRKLAWSTSLLISIWSTCPESYHSQLCLMASAGIIGLASTLYNNFLPFLLASRGAKFGDSSYYITYRNVCSPLSFLSVPLR